MATPTLERLTSKEQFLRTDHLQKDLGRRSISGTVVTVSAQIAKFVLNLGSTVILSRLLSPKDFGLIAMVTAITGFLRIFKDAGLSTATIQRETITHAQVSNLFWTNLALSGVLGVTVAMLAPVIAWFYDDPQLRGITLLLSTAFLFNGATVQHLALLNRQMRFKALALIDISAMAASLFVGVLMATLGYRYWSLVGASLASEVVAFSATMVVSRWRPQAPSWGSKTLPLLTFGANLTLGNLIFSIARGVDSALIGRFYGASAVGLYSRAMIMVMRPMEQFVVPIGAVFLPTLSRLQSEPQRYRGTFLRVFEATALMGFLLTATMLPLARPITLLLLGPKWEEAAMIFAGFTFATISMPLASASTWLFTSQGRAKDLLVATSVLSTITVISFVVGLPFGPFGVAIAFSASGCLIRLPILFHLAGRCGPVSARDLWFGFLRHLPVWLFVIALTLSAKIFSEAFAPIPQLLFSASLGLFGGLVFIFACPAHRRVADDFYKILRGWLFGA